MTYDTLRLFNWSPEESERIFLEGVRCLSAAKVIMQKDKASSAKIQAIKYLRSSAGLSLWEAKSLMDILCKVDDAYKEGKFVALVKGNEYV